MNSTKSAACFQLSCFKSNDFQPSDQYPRHLALKKSSQVTICIKPNDFKPNGIKPNGIKPSDHLPLKLPYYAWNLSKISSIGNPETGHTPPPPNGPQPPPQRATKTPKIKSPRSYAKTIDFKHFLENKSSKIVFLP